MCAGKEVEKQFYYVGTIGMTRQISCSLLSQPMESSLSI